MVEVVQDCRNQKAPKHFFYEGIFQVFNFANMEAEDRVDPMSKVFPRMTKCNFHKYGGSGTIEVIDALCVLSMNIINEKIYILHLELFPFCNWTFFPNLKYIFLPFSNWIFFQFLNKLLFTFSNS